MLADADSELDIDGNGESKALSDGLLLIRYLFGFTRDALIVGAIGEGATKTPLRPLKPTSGIGFQRRNKLTPQNLLNFSVFSWGKRFGKLPELPSEQNDWCKIWFIRS